MNDMKQAKAECNLTKMLLPSVLSILLCLVLLCGMTWAWFESTQSAPAAPIVSATYRMEVTVENGTGVLQKNSDESYTLAANVEYTVRLVASGNASKGYCKVTLPDNSVLRTEQIAPENSLAFTLTLTSDGEVSFSSEWGTYSGTAEITSGCTISK